MKKSGSLYLIVIAVWIGCVGLLTYATARLIFSLGGDSSWQKGIVVSLLVLNSVTLALLWFGSVKDFCFSFCYLVKKKSFARTYAQLLKDGAEVSPKYLLLYCTCNDFNGEALARCMAQRWGNFRTFILDDSTEEESRREIDAFARERPVTVVRRENGKGYKAGNLNHFLQGRTDYDYFVVLDSDEVIPNDYLFQVTRYFSSFRRLGAVQARHIAYGEKNLFQKLMGMSVESNGRTAQLVKNFYGANALIGHGMTLSRQCYEDTGGFPEVVAEDISMAVEIKNHDYHIVYAPDIVCYEQFPIDCLSLKKRQCKWTQGNLEYMQKYHKDIVRSKMQWFEKLDVMLSHYSLPIVPVLSFNLALVLILLGLVGFPVIAYSLAVYAIMIILLCSPLLPDLFVRRKTTGAGWLPLYFIVNIMTYASFAPMMLRTVFSGVMGKKATFLVTPKKGKKFTVWEAMRKSLDSLLFGFALSLSGYFACGSVLPVIFPVSGCLLAPFIILLSNIPVKENPLF